MKIITAEIFLFSLLLITLTNLTISNRAFEFARSKEELTDFDNLSNALNTLNGKATIKKRELTANELRDINKYKRLNERGCNLNCVS